VVRGVEEACGGTHRGAFHVRPRGSALRCRRPDRPVRSRHLMGDWGGGWACWPGTGKSRSSSW
jgi:hypothetical protein